jgi:Fe2+ transport system protein FeoA
MPHIQNLSTSSCGSVLEVTSLACSPECAQRLQEMGFVKNAVVRKLCDNGNIICSIFGCRVAIQAELGRMIGVRPLESRSPRAC